MRRAAHLRIERAHYTPIRRACALLFFMPHTLSHTRACVHPAHSNNQHRATTVINIYTYARATPPHVIATQTLVRSKLAPVMNSQTSVMTRFAFVIARTVLVIVKLVLVSIKFTPVRSKLVSVIWRRALVISRFTPVMPAFALVISITIHVIVNHALVSPIRAVVRTIPVIVSRNLRLYEVRIYGCYA